MLHMLHLAQQRCASLDELCHNEMSRDHDAPVEYLRKLASLKLRFGLAALATAHGALPVRYPMVALDTQLRNRRAAARSFLIHALVVKQLSVASHRLVICWSPSNIMAIFVAISPQQVTPRYESSRRRYSPIQVTPIRITISSIVHSSRLEHCSRSGRPPPNSTYFAGRLPTMRPSKDIGPTL